MAEMRVRRRRAYDVAHTTSPANSKDPRSPSYMRRDLVEERGWYSHGEYQQGLAIAQTMPAQLAMWLGYLERGARGALWVALPFVMPPFLLVTAVAALYAHYRGLSQVQSVFFGVGPAVMAIIAIAAYKLARSTNKHDLLLWTIATIVCVSTVISGSEIVWLFLAAGLFGTLYYGGGIPRLRGSAASMVPLPLATVKGFVWLAAGGSLGTLGLFVVVPGRLFRRFERHPRLQGFVKERRPPRPARSPAPQS